ncbi:MAG TPA: GNAT family N-acetyltransferase [Hydrogenophaga sp.]|uniref:GNAT family N-acetyltransferase n=1 Tax=Hydrogenophaga sp. TaxID=1904254 RepID=UPI002BEBF95D|nr:GNAT family N-acetyltransferase [Hydrogenophaga sp.]HSX93713.1 GNAT family N-acetyltransferase [Hydrogenophaga sp.]
MAPSEALTLVVLGPDDAPDGLALSDAAGWNQTAEDWRFFVRQGRVFGLRAADNGRLVATAAALPYDSGVGQVVGNGVGGGIGWISMVLVAAEWRHQGLASSLMGHCIAHLRALGATPVLDATPAGQPAYAKLGFQAGFALSRWEGTLAHGPSMPTAGAVNAQAIARLDAQANGFDRRTLLTDFLQRPGTRARVAADGNGFVLARQGRRATQLGPLVAGDEASALSLLQAAFAELSGPVFLDVPERWTVLTAWLAQHGFARQRSFARMALGPAPIASVHDRLFVVAGPEFG